MDNKDKPQVPPGMEQFDDDENPFADLRPGAHPVAPVDDRPLRYFWVGERSEVYVAHDIDELRNWHDDGGPTWAQMVVGAEKGADQWGEVPSEKHYSKIYDETGDIETRTIAEWHKLSGDPQVPTLVWSRYEDTDDLDDDEDSSDE